MLVYRYNERKTGQRNQSVRMLAHLMDLGGDGAVPSTAAKKMVLQEAGGDVTRAQQAWTGRGPAGERSRSASTSWSRPAWPRGKPDSGADNSA